MSVVTPTITSAGKAMPDTFELLSVDVVKAVDRVPYARLILRDGDMPNQTFPVNDDAFFEPGKEVMIKLRYEGDTSSEETIFIGLVVGHRLDVDLRGSTLTVELKDAAFKMTQVRKSAVYSEQTDDKIIGKLISSAKLKKGKIPATTITHAQLVQYYCTDWDFMLSRADALGMLVIANDGEISLAEIGSKGTGTHRIEVGLDDVYSFTLEADAAAQLGEVQSTAWDAKKLARAKPAKAKALKLQQSNFDAAKLSKTIGVEPALLNSTVQLDPKELQSWSDATLARNRMAFLRGSISVPGFGKITLLDSLELKGISERFNGKTIVTGIRHRLDLQGWQTDIQFGLPAQRFAERPHINDAPAAGLLPAVNGLQIGIVAAFEADPDKAFRVKVTLPAIDENEGHVWARLAMPDAGNKHGIFFYPEVGDEVVVGFFNDDPRQAVILGAMFGSKQAIPAAIAPPDDKNLEKGIVTKTGTTIKFTDAKKPMLTIETPGANSIVIDDDAQQIEIKDQHGNSITMSKDGIVLKSAKDFKVDASGNVEIKGTKVDVK